MAFENSGARLIKEERQSLAGYKLKASEVRMLFALLIVGISVLTAYFLLLPMFTNLSALSDEVEGLQRQQDEKRLQIARTAEFQDMYDDAQSEYYRYISYFYEPMAPEMIDERITSMLLAHNMTPASLSMTTLQVEAVPQYMADELRASPLPVMPDSDTAIIVDGAVATGAQGAGGGDVGDGPAPGTAADGADADAAETPSQASDGSDSYAFVYTIKATAYGKRDSLYAFLAQASNMTAMEVTSFSYADPKPETAADSGEKDAADAGSINMEIKLYVFVEGVMAKDRAENK